MDMKLCESDYRFMTIVWDNEPVASGELVKLCAAKRGWKKSTTYTVLKKLIERGFAKNEDYVITSLVSKDNAQAFASNRFVESNFHGSLPGFLVAFLSSNKISEQEAQELKELIDKYKV